VVGNFVTSTAPALRRAAGEPSDLGNMSPEYGSTCAIFPIDAETLTICGRPDAPSSRYD
jgi:aconitate hydratase